MGNLLPGALRTAVESFPAHGPDAIPRALVRGKQIRRARRIRLSAAACAVAVAVAGGVVALDRTMDADGSAASRRTLPDSELPTSWPVTGDQMISVLKSLMPAKGKVSDVSGQGSQPNPTDPPLAGMNPYAQLVYRDAGGVSGVRVTVSRPAPGTPDFEIAKCVAADGRRQYDDCNTSKRSDGSMLTVAKTLTDPWGEPRQRRWRVILDRPDGGRVALDTYSGGVRDQHIGSDKGVIGVTEDPRLTVDQLIGIVTDSRWKGAVSALPTPESRSLAILESLLPAGTKVTRKGERETGPTVVVSDAKGLSTVSAGVRRTGEPLWTCAEIADCSTKPLADGATLVASRQSVRNGPPEFVYWTVSVRYADGLTVWIHSGNEAGDGLILSDDEDPLGGLTLTDGDNKPSRAEPVLTLDQLEAIATSPRWTE
ncbi:hypothetical protein [Embleya sp. NBC_00896]|uniref:hypothetical protein n=1 Tax=Embleya sp. NBC_00896 TaxID=2975961 RepID=UPI0038650BAE|nr:hypothetical protein OG928_16385 [Embleya sp. NBC_00896]